MVMAATDDAVRSDAVFRKGVGIQLWQSSGDDTSNWSALLRRWSLGNALRLCMARLQGMFTVLERSPGTWDNVGTV
jgi:hypothetical protein